MPVPLRSVLIDPYPVRLRGTHAWFARHPQVTGLVVLTAIAAAIAAGLLGALLLINIAMGCGEPGGACWNLDAVNGPNR